MLSKSTHNFTAQTPPDAGNDGHKAKPGIGAEWRTGRFSWAVDAEAPVVVMGIVNVTPDSFSDGGQHNSTKSALIHAERLVAEGAHILDVGGESTRPGAAAVSVDQEIARVLPVIIALVEKGYCVSVDTRKPRVMREALKAGASIVNDVMALTAAGAIEACAASNCGVVFMHMRGSPETMQVEPHYDDVIGEVGDYLVARAQACEAAGIASDRIVLDPGFGFGKTLQHNLTLTQNLDALVARGYPVLAGWSRKKTIGTLTGRDVPAERVYGSVAAALACVAQGARVVRVHDVGATVDALKVWRAMAG